MGEKDKVEQNPSEEDMSNVKPSLDLFCRQHTVLKPKDAGVTYQARSVKVAQCRLLTMQIGVSCCVSYSRTESWVATA